MHTTIYAADPVSYMDDNEDNSDTDEHASGGDNA